MAVLVALLVLVDVLGDLDLQGCNEHPPCALAGDGVEVELGVVIGSGIGYLEHGWRPSPRLQPRVRVSFTRKDSRVRSRIQAGVRSRIDTTIGRCTPVTC